MNKQKFLDNLAKNLEKNNVDEIRDIIEEYNEHFLRKMADGFSEEEIVSKLEKPEDIAAQYESNADTSTSKQVNKLQLTFGIDFIALGVASAALTINCYMLTVKLGTAWLKWQNNVLSGKKNVPYSVFPLFNNSFKHKLRKVTIIASAIFGVLFVITFISMVLSSGRVEFWHAWRWFNYAG